MLEGSTVTVGEIMTRDVVTVSPDTSLRHVAKLLAKHRISGVPVVEADGSVVGLVSENDLLNWSDAPAERQAWWLDMLAEGSELAPEFLDLVQAEREKVRRVMRADVVTVTEGMTLGEVAKLLVERSFKRLPVVRDGKLVGVVSRGDLVGAMAKA